MKNFISLFSLLFILFFGLTACGNQENVEATVVGEGNGFKEYNYKNFNKIVFKQEGEFIGLDLLDDRTTVKTKLPADALFEETEDFLYYKWNIDGNDYKVDLFFNKENQLKSIDAYISFYNENKEKDRETAELFYKDMTKYFTEKYGKDNLETNEATINSNDLKYNYWNFDEKEVEIGLDDVEVYWYINSPESLIEIIEEPTE